MRKTIFSAAALALLLGAPAAYAQATAPATAGKNEPAKPSTPMNATGSPAAPSDCAKMTDKKAHDACMAGNAKMKKM